MKSLMPNIHPEHGW